VITPFGIFKFSSPSPPTKLSIIAKNHKLKSQILLIAIGLDFGVMEFNATWWRKPEYPEKTTELP
jgi:hypothetical protein